MLSTMLMESRMNFGKEWKICLDGISTRQKQYKSKKEWMSQKRKLIMGDMADYDIEQGEDMWFDHLAGHPQFPSDYCPYCEEDDN